MIPVIAAAVFGVGSFLLIGQLNKKKIPPLSSFPPSPALTLPPAAKAQIKQDTAKDLANGTALLGTNGLPFNVTSPFDPSKTPAQLIDPATGQLAILPTDQITVDAGILGSTLPGGLPFTGNILMEVKSLIDPKNGPVMAESRDPRFNPGGAIPVPPSAITSVTPLDTAAVIVDAIGN